jgi:hypothetical protein
VPTYLAFGEGPLLVVLPDLGEHATASRGERRRHQRKVGLLAEDITVHVVNHRRAFFRHDDPRRLGRRDVIPSAW